jgi:ComF family protein
MQRRSCIDCRGRELHFDLARQAAEFSVLVRSAVHQFKYSGSRVMKVFLAALVVEMVEDLEIDLGAVTWVPASQQRLRSTGVDHGRILAELVADGSGVASAPMLVRTRPSAPQMRMEPEARRTNLAGAFAAAVTPPAVVTLVDDVYTTGSTAAEAARALKAAGASQVKVLCVARSFESL